MSEHKIKPVATVVTTENEIYAGAMKRCTKCGVEKAESEFGRRAAGTKLMSKCKACMLLAGNVWRTKNRESVRAGERRRKRANREIICQQRREWYRANKWRMRGYACHQPEYRRQRSLCKAARCDDGYVRRVLTQNSPLSFMDIPQSLVEVKRQHLLLTRALRSHT